MAAKSVKKNSDANLALNLFFQEKLKKNFFESIHLYALLHSSHNVNDNTIQYNTIYHPLKD
jgi:hypothetical protein